MSEEILRVLLADLTHVRVACKHCKAVVEVSTDRLTDIESCPCCRKLLHDKGSDAKTGTGFVELAEALKLLTANPRASIEFVVRQPTSLPARAGEA